MTPALPESRRWRIFMLLSCELQSSQATLETSPASSLGTGARGTCCCGTCCCGTSPSRKDFGEKKVQTPENFFQIAEGSGAEGLPLTTSHGGRTLGCTSLLRVFCHGFWRQAAGMMFVGTALPDTPLPRDQVLQGRAGTQAGHLFLL